LRGDFGVLMQRRGSRASAAAPWDERSLAPESHKRCFATEAKLPPFKAIALTGTGRGWVGRLDFRRLKETARP
jgi:hypothetical protein